MPQRAPDPLARGHFLTRRQPTEHGQQEGEGGIGIAQPELNGL
jgi:hypothetical protein